MLNSSTFKIVAQNTPLVSIDLCLVCADQILLGKRKNEPLRGRWFTPGARIFKNEPWADCLERVARSELGLNIFGQDEFRLMSVWDHFYQNSVMDESVSTHYVNLPHYMYFEKKPNLHLDDQHEELGWFNIDEVANNNNSHEYIRIYADSNGLIRMPKWLEIK